MTEKVFDPGTFFDREADGGKGAEISGRIAHVVQYVMEHSTQCVARGVMLMDDGRVYTWTVRRPGQGDIIARPDGGEVCRIATLMDHGTFADHARNLLEFERPYIDTDLHAFYLSQVDAL